MSITDRCPLILLCTFLYETDMKETSFIERCLNWPGVLYHRFYCGSRLCFIFSHEPYLGTQCQWRIEWSLTLQWFIFLNPLDYLYIVSPKFCDLQRLTPGLSDQSIRIITSPARTIIVLCGFWIVFQIHYLTFDVGRFARYIVVLRPDLDCTLFSILLSFVITYGTCCNQVPYLS